MEEENSEDITEDYIQFANKEDRILFKLYDCDHVEEFYLDKDKYTKKQEV